MIISSKNCLTLSAKLELQKFFKLAVIYPGEITMFSEYLDEAWHELLKDKNIYEDFCIQSCGHAIEHIASHIPGASGYGKINWLPYYESFFGTLHQDWFKDSNGNVNWETFNKYKRTGGVIAAWKCNPKMKS